ncbi:hypothetical protein [Nostoc sp.]|uniref:hypothetical protein n=1 Tax=Nostoc sp. TaxID=1180 RepID=UPI002FF40DE4
MLHSTETIFELLAKKEADLLIAVVLVAEIVATSRHRATHKIYTQFCKIHLQAKNRQPYAQQYLLD